MSNITFDELLETVHDRKRNLKVVELLMTDQDCYVVEVYNEDANVVLMDDGDCDWDPDKIVLCSHRQHVMQVYGLQRVYRWSKKGVILRLCLGRVKEPPVDILKEAEEWMGRQEKYMKGKFNKEGE